MSQNEDTTRGTVRAIVDLNHLNGGRYSAAEVFQDLAEDYFSERYMWREVTPQFARYCMEAMPPVHGPEGSRSIALGECFDVTRKGAVHCVIAQEDGRHFAKYVNLMLWADELLGLRNLLAAQRKTCAGDGEACRRQASDAADPAAKEGGDGSR